MTERDSSRRVRTLRDDVARKIAAGEVIDRPSSIVRELLDNAIDAGASEITVHADGGGIAGIRVIDNGTGMTGEDLSICFLPHTTSKISEAEDIYRVTTLGFRGEALSSMAAGARLEIVSSADGGATSHRLLIEEGRLPDLSECRGTGGTIVSVTDLFHSIPARRRFLKRPSTEAALCRRTFIEKALPFPAVSFRLFMDGDMKLFLPRAELQDRVLQVHGNGLSAETVLSASGSGEHYRISVVAGDPSVVSRDRRGISIYVNSRRINEYALVQAVEYGFSEFLPGGSFPVAAVFIDIDPELTDFNIHPAKREVRIRILPEIHHALVMTIKDGLSGYRKAERPDNASRFDHPGLPGIADHVSESSHPFMGSSAPSREARNLPGNRVFERLAEAAARSGSILRDAPSEDRIEYFGQLFGLFLLVGAGDEFYIIDQHAAHERIIYDSLRESPPPPQTLLIPHTIELETDEDEYLLTHHDLLESVGIILERTGDRTWSITALPDAASFIKGDFADFVKTMHGSSAEIHQVFYETVACKAAVKDGEVLDDISATALARKALALEHPRCPHGRPVWIRLRREELFALVGRT